jgi:hypothetical protein
MDAQAILALVAEYDHWEYAAAVLQDDLEIAAEDLDRFEDDVQVIHESLTAAEAMRGDDPLWAAWYYDGLEHVTADWVQDVRAPQMQDIAVKAAQRLAGDN